MINNTLRPLGLFIGVHCNPPLSCSNPVTIIKYDGHLFASWYDREEEVFENLPSRETKTKGVIQCLTIRSQSINSLERSVSIAVLNLDICAVVQKQLIYSTEILSSVKLQV